MAANIKPLKMCINITIPSVGDSDLSLYEAMCTLAGKLQDTIKEINEILADVVVTVNGKQGPDVVISGDDISVSSTDDQSISGVLSQKYSADNPPPYPVVTVNGKQGNVTLSAGDINTSTGKTVGQTLQENTDDITSLEAVMSMKYGDDNPPPYPVTSVAAKTGQVMLTGNDVTLIGGNTVGDAINDIKVEMTRKLEFTSVASTSWDSVKDRGCGIYRTTGFVPWSSSIQDNGLLFILGNYTSIVAYIFIRESVSDNVYFAIGRDPSASDWYFIAGNPISG